MIDFGEKAAAFQRRAGESVHYEHLLVWYSVELLLKARKAIHPKTRPITEEGLETFYRHFEDAIPLGGKFLKYSASMAHFEPDIRRWQLPSLNFGV